MGSPVGSIALLEKKKNPSCRLFAAPSWNNLLIAIFPVAWKTGAYKNLKPAPDITSKANLEKIYIVVTNNPLSANVFISKQSS
jgi:hypothetical protein